VSIRELRPSLLDKRIVLAGLIAALIVLPNLLWALQHPELALRSAGKFKIQESGHWFKALATGLEQLAFCTVMFFGLFTALCGIVFWKKPQREEQVAGNNYARLLLRMLLISYGLIVLAIVVFRISNVRDRWLQPILICSPVFAIAWLQSRVNAVRLKWVFA